jgi:hypothetical protein
MKKAFASVITFDATSRHFAKTLAVAVLCTVYREPAFDQTPEFVYTLAFITFGFILSCFGRTSIKPAWP